MRLLGFATLPCGCVVGRYREVPIAREIVYVEEKDPTCPDPAHRRNHPLRPGLGGAGARAFPPAALTRAS